MPPWQCRQAWGEMWPRKETSPALEHEGCGL